MNPSVPEVARSTSRQIIKILRNENNGQFEYNINSNLIIIIGNGNKVSIPIEICADAELSLIAGILL